MRLAQNMYVFRWMCIGYIYKGPWPGLNLGSFLASWLSHGVRPDTSSLNQSPSLKER